MKKIDRLLGIIFLALNAALLFFIGTTFKFLIVGFVMLILGAALKFNKPIKIKKRKKKRKKSKSLIVNDDAIRLACDRKEAEQFQTEFMSALKKTLDMDSNPSLLREAYLLSSNGRLNSWEKRCRKRK